MRLGKQAWARRGVHAHSRTLEGKQKTQLLLRLRSTSRRGDDGRVAYRCWTLTAAVNFVGLDAAAAQFERGQREPDLT